MGEMGMQFFRPWTSSQHMEIQMSQGWKEDVRDGKVDGVVGQMESSVVSLLWRGRRTLLPQSVS